MHKEKFKNKYRIETTRAQWWDYSGDGAYFITICTKNMEHFFGEIVDKKMNLSAIGQFAQSCWIDIPKHFPFVKLGEFVVMPNHVHGIIIVDKKDSVCGEKTDKPTNTNVETHVGVETQNFAFLHRQPPQKENVNKNKFGPQSKNLASIIRGYKIGVTKNARLINPGFKWQPRYHDRIIRDEYHFRKSSYYIINNPKNWDYKKSDTD